MTSAKSKNTAYHKNLVLRDHFFLDILVEGKMIVEVKATEKDNPIYQAQLLTYLRLSGIKVGLIINFGKKHVKDEICRVVNSLCLQCVL